jgi:SRSO17 transposase
LIDSPLPAILRNKNAERRQAMLPEIRQSDYLYDVPKFDLVRTDIDDLINDLKAFHEDFADCFQRSESRDNFLRYMSGQFSPIERKSIEPISFAIEGAQVRAMQRFVSDAPWDDKKIMAKYRYLVNEDLGHPDGAIVFDESGFQKKGDDSIGVGRQYCGSIGKVENCQVGVFASYTSPHGYALIDKRLYLPEKWFTEEYEARRKKCKLPSDFVFKTKPQLAAEMLKEFTEKQQLPFRYILADSVYATSPEFIDVAESLVDVTYMVQMPSNTKCWLKRPATIQKSYQYGGKHRIKRVITDQATAPTTFTDFASNLAKVFWYRRIVSEGTKGPIEYEFTRRQVILCKDNQPTRTVWLLVRRSITAEPEYSYFISNASTSVLLKTLVWLSGLRWSIEQCFEETKTELGMDHYEVRKFPGWHHHMLTCMMAHFFLWHQKIRLGKKSAIAYSIAA